MLVYASQLAPRLSYVLEFITQELFDEPIKITNNQQEFLSFDGPKINYSPARFSGNEFWINNVELLFQTGINAQTIDCFKVNGNIAFFERKQCDYNFDIFAAVFYLITRYEEHLPHIKDKYGRYGHANSIAHNESFLHLPLVNIWLMDFKNALSEVYPVLQFRNKTFAFQPTYDIDIAWSYRNKGWWRNTGGLLRSVLILDWYRIKERIGVLFDKELDPFDSYQWLNDIHSLLDVKAIYFFLLSFKQKGNDKNISPFKNELRELIKGCDLIYTTGIHPSWQSGDDYSLLEAEIKELEFITDHDITHSRQHYLRFTLPSTYQRLIALGIRNEYSMGYGTVNGFRASVASSFFWYDLENERSTKLRIHPFCFMDANAYYELKLSPVKALAELFDLYTIIKSVDGLMITLWHNNFLGTDREFAGWRNVYEKFLRSVIKRPV